MNGGMQMTARRGTEAVLFAKEVDRMVAFYCEAVGLTLSRTQTDHVVLESPIFHFVVLGIPGTSPMGSPFENPPVRRGKTPVQCESRVDHDSAPRFEAHPVLRGWLRRRRAKPPLYRSRESSFVEQLR
jgi:hypothetical protein